MRPLLKSLFLVAVLAMAGTAQMTPRTWDARTFGATPDDATLDTRAIQAAIDDCAAKGGGTVLLEGGKFRSGILALKSRITLRIAKGVVLEGSTDPADYGAATWQDPFIRVHDAQNVRIEGEGAIDVSMSGVTVRNSGNYNIICRNVQRATFENVKIRGGHDGINAWGSTGFTIRGCDIRTGDDGIAVPA